MKTVKKPISDRRLLLWIIFAIAWCAFGIWALSVSVGSDWDVPGRAKDHFRGIKHGGGDDACLLHAMLTVVTTPIFLIYGGLSALLVVRKANPKAIRGVGLVSLSLSVFLLLIWAMLSLSFSHRGIMQEEPTHSSLETSIERSLPPQP
jgi:hypothetical protein